MEVKKSPKADLQNKRSYFIGIGLLVAMGIMIALFSWSQSKKVVEIVTNNGDVVEQDVMDVTVQDQKPPEPIKVQPAFISDVLQIVKNDSKIEQEITLFDDFDASSLSNMEVKSFGGGKEELVEEDIPVIVAEEMPSFKGKDINEFRKWCGDNLVYPQLALDNGVQGRVVLTFVVERDGSVSNVKVVRGVDNDLNAAAVKVVSNSPKWSPGKNRGKPVRFTYNMPIDFILQQ